MKSRHEITRMLSRKNKLTDLEWSELIQFRAEDMSWLMRLGHLHLESILELGRRYQFPCFKITPKCPVIGPKDFDLATKGLFWTQYTYTKGAKVRSIFIYGLTYDQQGKLVWILAKLEFKTNKGDLRYQIHKVTKIRLKVVTLIELFKMASIMPREVNGRLTQTLYSYSNILEQKLSNVNSTVESFKFQDKLYGNL